MLLWTRLAPVPYQADGGLPARRVTVEWEVALDARFRSVVDAGRPPPTRSSTTPCTSRWAGSPRPRPPLPLPRGRFVSPAGRTRTAPAARSRAADLTFGVVSCQRYDQGYYTAYRHLADEDLDVVLHLGDYLYEYAVNDAAGARAYPAGTLPSGLFNHETVTLEDYRLRYALYKSDPDLRAAHAAHPSSSPGTTTRPRTTTPTTPPRTASRRRSSCCAGPPPTAPTGRTCRCASSPRAPT